MKIGDKVILIPTSGRRYAEHCVYKTGIIADKGNYPVYDYKVNFYNIKIGGRVLKMVPQHVDERDIIKYTEHRKYLHLKHKI